MQLPEIVTENWYWVVMIPNWHPLRINELLAMNHFARARRKKQDYAIIGHYLMQAGVTKAHGIRRVGLEIVLAPRQRGGDPDAYWKSLLDGMVKCGALVDDNRQNVGLEPVEYSRGKMAQTIITITDC